MKPKEWSLWKYLDSGSGLWRVWTEPTIVNDPEIEFVHVIEKAAYDRLEMALNRVLREVEKNTDRDFYDHCKAKVDRLLNDSCVESGG